MTMAWIRRLSCASAVWLLLFVAVGEAQAQVIPCLASDSWIGDSVPPAEIPNEGKTFCDFYRFSWQWFLHLVAPSGDGDLRRFEVSDGYPQWFGPEADSCGVGIATLQGPGDEQEVSTSRGSAFFERTPKGSTPSVPERIHQARSGAVIYDQRGSAVLYEVRFGRELCNAEAKGNLPAGTKEIKTAWRQIETHEEDRFYWVETVVDGLSPGPVRLGLVGFHLFLTTSKHPEGVWMTWEHRDNAPNCDNPGEAPSEGWSFVSDTCAQCLEYSDRGPLACPSCEFNQASSSENTEGRPTEICRVYPSGTGPGDANASENLLAIGNLNDQLVGLDGFLTRLPKKDPMAVWKNYFQVGGLWVLDPSRPADAQNQCGSLQLTDSVLESTFQGDFKAAGQGTVVRTGAVNCFGCHAYVPKETATSGLSHIFGTIHGKR